MPQPFSYYGGKQRMMSNIIPYIPQHTVYAEVFAGGASIFWNKPDYNTGDNNYREVLNDTNSLIFNFFKVMQTQGKELNHLIVNSLYSEEEYRNAKKYDGDDSLMKAYYFYVNIQQSFANKLNSGWGRGQLGKNHSITYKNQRKRFQQFIDRIQNCYISNCDAIKCIKDWDSPQTFFYCDPPYPETNQGHYSGYTQKDFENLITALDECKGSFILSCYPNDAVPKDWEKVEFEATTSASNTTKGGHRDKRTECIWIRQAKVTPRPEILKIYEKQNQLQLF